MARNRRRAAERKGRQRPEEGNGAPEPVERLHRADQPGSLDHASGEVDEAEASIVAGADGEPLDDVDEDALEAEAVDEGRRREVAAPASAVMLPRRRRRLSLLLASLCSLSVARHGIESPTGSPGGPCGSGTTCSTCAC